MFFDHKIETYSSIISENQMFDSVPRLQILLNFISITLHFDYLFVLKDYAISPPNSCIKPDTLFLNSSIMEASNPR